ncbi:MAG TPA: DNA replication and repair protein RecF, partial [Terrimesophilobacter sp.]|nr:DNA replication and repair protein RecF [Terrimesophilobacter sp.]
PRHVSTVVFAPEDLAIVRGEPSVRRRFLDELLVLLSPRIAGVIADYDRVVRQRNTLLKTARSTGAKELSTLDVWDDKLVSLGSELIVARAELVRDLEPHVIAAYHSIAGTEHTVRLASQLSVLASDPDVDPAEASVEDLTLEHVTQNFRSALANLRPRERERAVTLVGPHRDDVLLELNGMPARGYASHGESWSLALSLKLAAAEVLRRDSLLGDPVLVLDDVFAELDESRRQRLAVAIDGFEQVLITAAVLGDVPPALAGHTVRIEGGTIVETSSG